MREMRHLEQVSSNTHANTQTHPTGVVLAHTSLSNHHQVLKKDTAVPETALIRVGVVV